MQGTQGPTGCRSCAASVEGCDGPTPSNWFLMLSAIGYVALAALAALAISSLVSPAHAETGATAPTPERQKELVHLVRQECGFCHGLRLTGGLGSPLTAEAMKDRPGEAMVITILQGRPGTAMPGWAPFLTEQETQWIVQQLQQGFPQ